MVRARNRSFRYSLFLSLGGLLVLLAWTAATIGKAERTPPADPAAEYTAKVRPLLKQYCFSCHGAKRKRGDLDLEAFVSLDQIRKDTLAWQAVLESLESGNMPPRKSPQLSEEQRRQILAWTRNLLAAEARSRAGDPGRVVVRRLSNAEYTNTLRDLTGVDLQPARDFPIDGAAGEGFTNAGDALATSSTLLNKYLGAAKEIANHAVLLPDGFRFSTARTRRDWTDEVRNEIRTFYARYSGDGRLPLRPYLAATIRHREELAAGRITVEAVARQEKINAKYLRILWQTLTDRTPSFPLDGIRDRWRQAKPENTDALVADIAAWQGLLWRFVPIGSYRYGNTIRQLPNEPPLAATHPIKVQVKPQPGQKDVVLYLSARELPAARQDSYVVWQRPRFEVAGKPTLLLRDYAAFGPRYEVDYQAIFADTVKYLDAAIEAAGDPKQTPDELARKHSLNVALLQRWIDVLGLAPSDGQAGRSVPAVTLERLDTPLPKRKDRPAVNGWGPRGSDLPVVVANASNQVEHIPGRVSPHGVAMHPTPTQFVAAVWKSPLEGKVRVRARIAHAHPACGNGVAYWLEQRRGERAFLLAEGAVDLGKESTLPPRELKVGKGDLLTLAVDPRDGNHICDLTEVSFTITETEKPGRVWDLAADVADNVLAGNPHADKHGQADVWRFVRGPVRQIRQARIPAGSLLDRWRSLADPKQRGERDRLARQVQVLLTGNRPTPEKSPDRVLYDTLLSLDGPLLQGVDRSRLPRNRAADRSRYGLEAARFGRHPQGKTAEEASLIVPATSVLEVRVPASLLQERAFVVEGRLDAGSADRVVQFQVLTAPPRPDAPLNVGAPLVAAPGSEAAKRVLSGFADFRRCFPSFISYARVIPDDEVVCLKLFHREDDALIRLFLDAEQTKQLDHLWRDLRFISRYPVTENNQLPQFIGYVTQDQPKELLAYFESQREPFRKRAEAFLQDERDAEPKQRAALLDFAAKAYRRPLRAEEKAELQRLYDTLRSKKLSHEEAFRTVLTRVLISPSFLFRIEQPAPGKEPQPVSSWELASRLSYFLWATLPDAELRRLAADGSLQDPKVLAAQVARMLKDPRVRGLAVEFGTQWLHVRDIQQNREKNEKLFPTFDDTLRAALFEESALFFQDLFQEDRRLPDILDADYTFLNEPLARHYGIPGVVGPQWRRVTGVKKYGRGGVLTLGSVLTKQSGASRTSPVLRGNWLVEAMLGEKLPKPPPNVPILPDDEAGSEGTVRQMVEKHARIAECAVCHQRIDPFGFALENFDPIGRFRDKDLGGRPIDTKVRLKDGTAFEGIDGLRHYLLKQRGEEFERHFCRKLLGYALGRSVILSDQPLLDEMMEALKKNDHRLSVVVQTIARSKQFRYHRGLDATKDE